MNAPGKASAPAPDWRIGSPGGHSATARSGQPHFARGPDHAGDDAAMSRLTHVNAVAALVVVAGLFTIPVDAQAQMPSKKRVCVEVAHQPRFWGDPADMPGIDPARVERVKYMTGELAKTAGAAGAGLSYVKNEITAESLKGCDLLFIHIPSAKYGASEASAVATYIAGGGSLFLVMDQDSWSTLEQTKVNDLIRPFGVQFGGESPDAQAGGHTNPGPVTGTRLKISYHGARTVTGGTPFAFNDRSDANPFGVFKEVERGGRIIVMGDGMASLYMTSWEGVQDYQCQELMQAAFRWLLE
jgi:hypothetical protein